MQIQNKSRKVSVSIHCIYPKPTPRETPKLSPFPTPGFATIISIHKSLIQYIYIYIYGQPPSRHPFRTRACREPVVAVSRKERINVSIDAHPCHCLHIDLCIELYIHLLLHSCTHLVTHLFMHFCMYRFIRLFVQLWIYIFIYSSSYRCIDPSNYYSVVIFWLKCCLRPLSGISLSLSLSLVLSPLLNIILNPRLNHLVNAPPDLPPCYSKSSS